jgi:plasmid maintenance system killer protein
LAFHPFTGDMKERYAVKVSETWRITFAWDDGDAAHVDLEEYH